MDDAQTTTQVFSVGLREKRKKRKENIKNAYIKYTYLYLGQSVNLDYRFLTIKRFVPNTLLIAHPIEVMTHHYISIVVSL